MRCVFEQSPPGAEQEDPELTATSSPVSLPVYSADEDAGTQRETPGDSHVVTFSKAVEKWHLNTGTAGFLVTMEVGCCLPSHPVSNFTVIQQLFFQERSSSWFQKIHKCDLRHHSDVF